MVFPGHIAGGYIATRLILHSVSPALSSDQVLSMYIFGTFCGELPDIDIAIHSFKYYFKKGKVEHSASASGGHGKSDHREYITHAPIFWLLSGLLVALIGSIFGSAFITIGGFVLIAGTWSHFILDSIEYGIRWLWPFTNKRYSLLHTHKTAASSDSASFSFYWRFIRDSYFKQATFLVETCVSIAAMYLVFH